MSVPIIFSRRALRPLALILTLAVATALLSSCVSTAIMAANAMDRAATRKDVETARKKQIEIIKALQAKGSPMGDYLFAVANDEGWWPENRVSDPEKIKALYQKAIDKGSSDAMIRLGLMLVRGGSPQYSETEFLSFEQRDPEKGLALIQKGMNIRCFYIQPVPDFSSDRCFVQYSPAVWIETLFRDGLSKERSDGSTFTLISKNSIQESYWRQKNLACETSSQIKQKILACY